MIVHIANNCTRSGLATNKRVLPAFHYISCHSGGGVMEDLHFVGVGQAGVAPITIISEAALTAQGNKAYCSMDG